VETQRRGFLIASLSMTNVKCKGQLYWITIHIQMNSWSTSRQQTAFLTSDLHTQIDYWMEEIVKWKKDGGYFEGSGRDLLESTSIISYIFYKCYKIHVGRDSVASITTSYGLNDRGVGVRVPVGSRIFFSPRRPNRLWGPSNLLSQWVPVAIFPGVKRPGREADH
jgi:hypothetical protein